MKLLKCCDTFCLRKKRRLDTISKTIECTSNTIVPVFCDQLCYVFFVATDLLALFVVALICNLHYNFEFVSSKQQKEMICIWLSILYKHPQSSKFLNLKGWCFNTEHCICSFIRLINGPHEDVQKEYCCTLGLSWSCHRNIWKIKITKIITGLTINSKAWNISLESVQHFQFEFGY